MTITILCAGALARPGAGNAQERPEARPPLPAVIREGAIRRTLLRARIVAREHQRMLVPAELPEETWLRARFGLTGTVAACALPPDAHDAPTLLVRPVHLHLGLDHLMLVPLAPGALQRAEAEALMARANELIGEDGLALRIHQPDAWRLEADDSPAARADVAALAALTTRSMHMAAGRNIDAYQPAGAATQRWRQLSNLIQMGWFEHPVNVAREALGHLPVNGLWLEGSPGTTGRQPFDEVRTSDPVIAGLASRSGVQPRLIGIDVEAAADPAAWIDDSGSRAGVTMLLAPAFWQQAVGDGDALAWAQAWQRFEDWFRGLLGACPGLAAAHLRWVLTGERSCIELASAGTDRFKRWRRVHLTTLLGDAERAQLR